MARNPSKDFDRIMSERGDTSHSGLGTSCETLELVVTVVKLVPD